MNNLGNSLDFGNSLNLSESMDLSRAFQTGSNTLDLSGLVNPDSLNLELSGMPQMNLGEIVSNLDLKVSPDGMKQMACGLLTGYQEYAKTHPEADYSGLGEDFTAFLKTDAAKKIISDNIKDIIKSSGTVTITTEKIQELIKNIMAGYEQYITEKGYTDPDQFDEYLMEYLQTDEAKKIISDWMSEVMPEDPEIEITPEQLEKLSDDLVKGYLTYASENGLPDPSKMGEHFMAYLQTDDGKKQFQEGLSAMIDMDQLESQVSKIIGNYMNQAMGILGDSIGQALETQISSAMTQIIGQMTTGLESAMKQMMTNVGTQLQNSLGNAMQIDPTAFADAFQMNMTEDDLAELMMSMSGKGLASYDSICRNWICRFWWSCLLLTFDPKDFGKRKEWRKARTIIIGDGGRSGAMSRSLLTLMWLELNVLCHNNRRYDQLCVDCICSDFSCGIFHYDWCYYLHQCA